MAWRIAAHVVRGQVDNREHGIVRGQIWLAGLPGPVTLELAGNACADLAGCLLTFSNRRPPVPIGQRSTFAVEQRGHIGDLTASRKVRVFDVPVDEALAMNARGEKPVKGLANAVYLEWFSEANGRVVIESGDFDVEISPPEWRLSPADEQQRRTAAGAAWGGFLQGLDEAIQRQQRGAKDPETEDWDEHDYERFLRESDARTEKYMELFDKFADNEAAHDQIDEGMGWNQELTKEEREEEQRAIEELNAACEEVLDEAPEPPDPAREGLDWIRTPTGEIRHPLQYRCSESAQRFQQACAELGLDQGADDALAQFVHEFQITSAKLAGALGSIAKGHEPCDAAFTVAYLKRALGHLHQSQGGLEALAAKPPGQASLSAELIAEARGELFAIREAILRMMQELRDQPPGS